MRLPSMLALLALGCAPAATAQSDLALAPFRSISLSDGGHVVVRHGASQRVTLLTGDADIRVEGARLLVGRCRDCPRHDRPTVQVVTPALDALAVDDGGRLVLEGRFPAQARLAVAVSKGGAIDARALPAGLVTASVAQGGMIFTRALRRLDAAVSHGGAIAYWGEPRVTRAIGHGGVVWRGRAADAETPITDMMPHPPHVPPLRPMPPVGR